MDVSLCLEALEEALSLYGTPEIFNTDQGSQFTSEEFTEALNSLGIRISMDGKGRWVDNVFLEHLWKSVKYEEVYLKAYASLGEARLELKAYFDFYNYRKRHQGLDGRGPINKIHMDIRTSGLQFYTIPLHNFHPLFYAYAARTMVSSQFFVGAFLKNSFSCDETNRPAGHMMFISPAMIDPVYDKTF